MSNETKRDVILQLAKENRDLRMYDPECIEPKELIEQDYQDWVREYDAALPDDLPVIPKSVSDVIVKLKHKRFSLSGAMGYAAVVSLSSWMTLEHEEDFARAWVLGAWRVEKTGEIVKLEADK